MGLKERNLVRWPEPKRAVPAICGFLAGMFVVVGARADGTSVQLFFYCAAALFGYAALFGEMRQVQDPQ